MSHSVFAARRLLTGWFLVLLVGSGQDAVISLLRARAAGDEDGQSEERVAADRWFAEEVWAKAGERTCLKCHHADGEAAESEFLLRRVTLSLAARLPTEQERAAVKKQGLAAIDGVLDQVMEEDAFYARVTDLVVFV